METGGTGGPRKRRMFDWKKFGIAAFVLIALVYLFGPRESLSSSSWVSTADGLQDSINTGVIPEDGAIPPTGHNTNTDLITTPAGSKPPSSKPPPSTTHPTIHATSFDNDPDASRTTYCTTPYSASLPIVQYALMIDAGSTGSRIHVYKFNNCKASLSYEYETFKMTKPGLSSYDGRPDEAAQSLDELMDEAVRVVPQALRGCSPVAVKATAGLRLLGAEKSESILRTVRKHLEADYPFKVIEAKDGVEIMDGKDEGVYAWITANYLLQTISSSEDLDTGGAATSYAVLDLGGASTQIVFEPKWEDKKTEMAEGEHKYDLKFGKAGHVLYQHSYLGYGLMRARRSVHQLVDFMDSVRSPHKLSSPKGTGDWEYDDDEASSKRKISNPCLAVGTEREVEIEDDVTGKKRKVLVTGSDVGSFDACNRVIQLVMAKDSICEVKPCSFNGVYQPSLLDTFSHGKVLLLSYFFDRIHPLLPSTLSASSDTTSITSSSSTFDPDSARLKVSTIASLARTVCAGKSSWITHFQGPSSSSAKANKELMDDLEGRPEWCLDLTFMYGLLRLGYEFEDGRDVMIGKRIEGTELGWSLGAAIGMLGEGSVVCRA